MKRTMEVRKEKHKTKRGKESKEGRSDSKTPVLGIVERGIIGIYHWISEKHLQSYLDEFAYMYNSRKISGSNRFNLALANMGGRLKYKTLIA